MEQSLHLMTSGSPGTETEAAVKTGLIVIPDISGFTRFVTSTSIEEGRSITSELLLSMLEHNILGLEVSEIEGDAILFYKTGEIPHIKNILTQYEYFLDGFDKALQSCSIKFNRPLNLSLKLIAHYGEIAEYTIGNFRKLYGKPVVEAHALLKNSIESRSYVLITDQLMGVSSPYGAVHAHLGIKTSQQCEVYGEFRNICFTWYDYALKSDSSRIVTAP